MANTFLVEQEPLHFDGPQKLSEFLNLLPFENILIIGGPHITAHVIQMFNRTLRLCPSSVSRAIYVHCDGFCRPPSAEDSSYILLVFNSPGESPREHTASLYYIIQIPRIIHVRTVVIMFDINI